MSRDLTLLCISEGSLPVFITFFAYKAIYLVIGVFLAFENRKVNIKALNDSKYIAACVYCTVVACIPLVPIGILQALIDQNVRYTVLSLGIILSVFAILSLLFIPRVSHCMCEYYVIIMFVYIVISQYITIVLNHIITYFNGMF